MLRPVIALCLAALAGCSLFVDEPEPPIPPQGDCNAMSGFRDLFDTDELDPQWVVSMGGAVQFLGDPRTSGGQLEIPYLADDGTVGSRLTELQSRFAYDMSGQTISVRVDEPAPRWETSLELSAAGSADGVRIGIDDRSGNARLRAVNNDNGNFESIAEIPYDPDRHRYLVLRSENANLVYGGASDPAGNDLDVLISIPAPIAMDPVYASLSMSTDNNSFSEPGSAVFSEFNIAAPPAPTCSISGFDEEFERSDLGDDWELGSDGSGTAELGNGTLELTTGAGNVVGIGTRHAFDLTLSELLVEIQALPNGGVTTLMLVDAAGTRLAIQQRGDEVQFGTIVNSNIMGAPPTENPPSGRQVWRLADGEGVIEMSVEAGGDPITTTLQSNLDITRVGIEVELESSSESVIIESLTGELR